MKNLFRKPLRINDVTEQAIKPTKLEQCVDFYKAFWRFYRAEKKQFNDREVCRGCVRAVKQKLTNEEIRKQDWHARSVLLEKAKFKAAFEVIENPNQEVFVKTRDWINKYVVKPVLVLNGITFTLAAIDAMMGGKIFSYVALGAVVPLVAAVAFDYFVNHLPRTTTSLGLIAVFIDKDTLERKNENIVGGN